MTRGQELLRACRRSSLAPPPRLTVSQFADAELTITSGPLAGTHWRTDFAPHQRGIMDAFHEPGVEIVVVQGSSQWGKTATAVNIIAYHCKHDPCPILAVMPTVDPMAKDLAKNRIEPLIAASPALREVFGGPTKKSRDGSHTTLLKTFRGGFLAIGGANSAASLAARAIRFLYGDEIDRWPAELPGEGSTIAVAMKRTTTYRRRRRILLTSSPTLEGAPIHDWFQRGDQRRYEVPCPDCGHMHPYEWANVKWEDDDPSTAHLVCPACDYPISEAERVSILAQGEWRATAPARRDKSIVSFHIWEAYSPLSSLAAIVSGFLAAREKQKAGDAAEMHTWQNTTLGEPRPVNAGERIQTHVLLLRREVYGADLDVPAGACCLTMGVDTQDDRLELLVLAWGPGEECWFIERRTLWGDPARPEPWRELDAVFEMPYRHASGQRLHIQAACLDTAGHRTTYVYDYVGRKSAQRVFAIIGRDGQRPIVSSPALPKYGRDARQVPLYTVGVDAAKSLVLSRLAVIERGPGYVHLPMAEWADEECVSQLLSEKLVRTWKKGVPKDRWVKTRPRNEALDCAVYGTAALRILNPKLPQMLDILERAAQASGGAPRSRPAARRPSRGGPSRYLGG